ncbi:MAG: hypothetical protein UZ16_OP3001001069, partial [Candidatus Hinthialibacteria bacterium OLB16]
MTAGAFRIIISVGAVRERPYN